MHGFCCYDNIVRNAKCQLASACTRSVLGYYNCAAADDGATTTAAATATTTTTTTTYVVIVVIRVLSRVMTCSQWRNLIVQ